MLRQRVTFTSALLLEGVLALALLSATVFGLVRTVFSPVGLGGSTPSVVRDVGTRLFGLDYLGEVPSVRTQLDPSVEVTSSPPLYRYGAEAIPNGRGEFSGPYEAQVNVYGLTTTQRASFLGAGLAESIATIVVLVLLLRIVRSLRKGDPFVLANARRLQLIALTMVIGGIGASALRAWGQHLVLSDSAIRPFVDEHVAVTWLPLVAGAGVLLLAEVFRRGAVMRADLEGLV